MNKDNSVYETVLGLWKKKGKKEQNKKIEIRTDGIFLLTPGISGQTFLFFFFFLILLW